MAILYLMFKSELDFLPSFENGEISGMSLALKSKGL
jgi:hypothetical protein